MRQPCSGGHPSPMAVPAAIGISQRVAIRAKHLQIPDSIVGTVAILVVELDGQLPSSPMRYPAGFATVFFNPRFDQSLFEVSSPVSGVALDQQEFQVFSARSRDDVTSDDSL